MKLSAYRSEWLMHHVYCFFGAYWSKIHIAGRVLLCQALLVTYLLKYIVVCRILITNDVQDARLAPLFLLSALVNFVRNVDTRELNGLITPQRFNFFSGLFDMKGAKVC